MSLPIYTVGHSTRTIEEFVDLLRCGPVELLVDIRSTPRSRTNPQYNLDAFPASLTRLGIGYVHAPALGGRRGRERDVAPDVNAFWRHQGFHNFADYALGAAFHDGLAALRELASTVRCAVMCSEAVWWRCHRRIITDYLLAFGEDVYHLLSATHAEPATITPGAIPRADGTIVYPAADAAPHA